jgi:hypothetical protein
MQFPFPYFSYSGFNPGNTDLLKFLSLSRVATHVTAHRARMDTSAAQYMEGSGFELRIEYALPRQLPSVSTVNSGKLHYGSPTNPLELTVH